VDERVKHRRVCDSGAIYTRRRARRLVLGGRRRPGIAAIVANAK